MKLNLYDQTLFGEDYTTNPPRYFIPWRENSDGSRDQGEFEPSGRADGRSVKIIPNDKIIFKRNKHDGASSNHNHG